eukprot:9456894-Pyramimonas_sp.AAC.1
MRDLEDTDRREGIQSEGLHGEVDPQTKEVLFRRCTVESEERQAKLVFCCVGGEGCIGVGSTSIGPGSNKLGRCICAAPPPPPLGGEGSRFDIDRT